MARINLTARTLASLKPKKDRVDYFDTNLPGFCVRVTPRGVKSFSVMFRHAGRLRRHTIGTFPRLTLAKARQEAKEALRDAELGQDPAAKKKAQRQANTFEEMAADFIERYSKKRKRTWRDDQRMLDVYVLPKLKNVRASEITRADIRALVETLAENTPIQANRVLSLLKKLYNWAIASDLVEHSPCVGIPAPGVEHQRDRVLSEAELKKVWKGIEAQELLTTALFKLRLLTAQRGGEVASMRWQDVDLDSGWWVIPAEQSKNGLAYRVPLSPPAVWTLKAVRAEGKKSRAGWVFPKLLKVEKHIVDMHRPIMKIRKSAGVEFRPHDLRRTAASLMTGMGVPRLTVGKILNHAEPGVTAVYDRHSYDKEKREALDHWARRLMVIVSDIKEVVEAPAK